MSADVIPASAPRVTKNSIEYAFSCNNTIESILFHCRCPTSYKSKKVPATETSVLFTDLEYGVAYTLQATPIKPDGMELPPTIFPTVITCDQPQPPQNVIFSAVDNTLQVSWIPALTLAMDAPKWYVLESTDKVVRLTIESWRTDYRSPPIPGGTFTFNLYSVNDAGYSAPVTSQQAFNFI